MRIISYVYNKKRKI